MSSSTNQDSKLIICDEPKIHKPKAKKVISSINIPSVTKNKFYNNHPCKTPISRIVYQDTYFKNFWEEDFNKNKNYFNSISLEEIENDFLKIKKNNNEISKVEKELIGIIKKSVNSAEEENEKFERSENQFYKNFESDN